MWVAQLRCSVLCKSAVAHCFSQRYDDNAVDDHDVQLVRLTTATGEAVEAATGKLIA